MPENISIQTPIAYNVNLFTLFDILVNTTFGYTKVNDWITAWNLLDEPTKKRNIDRVKSSTGCNIPLNTSSGLVHLDFINLPSLM